MNIIFDTNHIESLQNNNIVLELDTFYVPKLSKNVTAHCVIDHVSISDLDKIQHVQNLHNTLMTAYKSKDFKLCQELIPHLIGSFSGEVDSFYLEMSNRIQDLLKTAVPADWTNVIVRSD
jgi:hypothetical protein